MPRHEDSEVHFGDLDADFDILWTRRPQSRGPAGVAAGGASPSTTRISTSRRRMPSIAKQLHSQHIARIHLKSMFRELDVRTQSELISHICELS